MKHEREFTAEDKEKRDVAKAKREAKADSTAKAYARLFASDDGKIVLADIRAKFGHERPRFDILQPTHDLVHAAVIDGQCSVLRDIEAGILVGSNKR